MSGTQQTWRVLADIARHRRAYPSRSRRGALKRQNLRASTRAGQPGRHQRGGGATSYHTPLQRRHTSAYRRKKLGCAFAARAALRAGTSNTRGTDAWLTSSLRTSNRLGRERRQLTQQLHDEHILPQHLLCKPISRSSSMCHCACISTSPTVQSVDREGGGGGGEDGLWLAHACDAGTGACMGASRSGARIWCHASSWNTALPYRPRRHQKTFQGSLKT